MKYEDLDRKAEQHERDLEQTRAQLEQLKADLKQAEEDRKEQLFSSKGIRTREYRDLQAKKEQLAEDIEAKEVYLAQLEAERITPEEVLAAWNEYEAKAAAAQQKDYAKFEALIKDPAQLYMRMVHRQIDELKLRRHLAAMAGYDPAQRGPSYSDEHSYLNSQGMKLSWRLPQGKPETNVRGMGACGPVGLILALVVECQSLPQEERRALAGAVANCFIA